MDSKIKPMGFNMGNPIIENHQECIDRNKEIEIVREIQTIAIRTNLNDDDFITGLDFKNPDIINNKVEFPMDNKEKLIIEYKDKCAECDEYLGDSYNVVYKFEDIQLSLNINAGGRINDFRIMDVKEVDGAGLDVTKQYVYLELSDYYNPYPFSSKIVKIHIQKISWDKINKDFTKENGRPIEVGDNLYSLVIDKQNRAVEYSCGMPNFPRDEEEKDK